MVKRKRNKSLTMMFTDSEYDRVIKFLKEGRKIYKNYSSVFLKFLENSNITINKVENKDVIRLLTSCSNNINQWTKGINTLGEKSDEDYIKLKSEVMELKKIVLDYSIRLNKIIKGK